MGDISVSVVGLGAMGTALARAQMAAGYDVTVWNRTPSKAEALLAEGAALATSASLASVLSDITLVCVDSCASAEDAMRDAWSEGALKGKVIVQLGTTTPAEARGFAQQVWAAGGMALDGAIMCYPDSVGPGNTAPLMVGGDERGYDIAEPALTQISGNLIALGDNVAAASALDLAFLTVSISQYAGVAHAARIAEAEGASLDTLAKVIGHGPHVQNRFEIIAKGAFALNSLHDGGSLGVWADVAKHVAAHAKESGIPGDVAQFLNAFYRRGTEAGFGDEDVAALVKLLRP